MNIPRYWADHRLQEKRSGRQVTVRRWGWSDTSEAEARSVAEARAKEAIARIWSGEPLRRREPLETYGNDEGMPIREEVVSRFPHAVITRNRYGSLCLNTPNVLFADVDATFRDPLRVNWGGCLLIVLASVALGIWQQSVWIGALVGIGVPWLWSAVNRRIRARRRPRLEAEARAEKLDGIRAFVAAHPAWCLRVYETPAGFRLLAMHDLFDPRAETTKTALEAMNSDRRFASLCLLQNCFRARVSPKYWRMGYRPAESLPKSKWPFPPEHLPRRRKWVEGYDRLAGGFASCRFLEQLGDGGLHPEAEEVRRIHDELCRAGSGLPIA
jgi:hypothetical protein